MSKHHHRDRSWAPAPEALPDDAQTIDNHTHVASVIPFARAMSHEAQEKGQPEVPVYDVDQLLAQAQSVGIGGIIDCGCELPHLMTAVQMALDHPGNVHAALAIHPNESVLHGHRGVPGPEQVVAIGETGMDLFRTGEGAKELQREAFRAHIALAKELGLPMQIHDRDSHREVIETLLADGAPERTVFHSYSGDREMAEIAREHGWYLSFSGTVSYKGNDGIRESLRIVGLDHAMVETDAPYLTPMPYRGRTNAPYMIPYTLRAMADTLDLPIADVARGTRDTARAVYGL